MLAYGCWCYLQKKSEAGKRKASFGNSEEVSPKQRKFNPGGQNVQKSKENVHQTTVPATKPSKPKPSPKKVQRDGEEHDRTFAKTSSLFRNNPEIPEMLSPAVTQVKEKMFTGNTFEELDLHPHLVATLNKVLNVTSMTSVQKETIPVLMAGKDAVVRSQTGSGKTLAYGIPLVQSLQAVQPKIQANVPPSLLLYLQPFTWIVPGVLMGGEKRKAEKARLRKGINILISTPGRLVDHIKNTLSIAFSAVRWLVLDEADRTLDLGFEKDLTVILNALNAAGTARQNVLLSATLTEGLSRLASISMSDPVYIQISEGDGSSKSAKPSSTTSEQSPDSQADLQAVTDSYAIPEKLQQHVVVVPSKLRLVCLATFILAKCKFQHGQKLIVFVSSCEVVEFLVTILSKVLESEPDTTSKRQQPINFLRLHGNMQQEVRLPVFSVFFFFVFFCVVKDVAARGLDLPQVTWIVQYNPPTSAAEYVHRVGRTARIGAQGNGLLFLTPSETAYVDSLANHNISLHEMKMDDILSTLMQDERFKGRGKWDSKKSAAAREHELRVRATVLQTEFENYVHGSAETVQAAKKALQSFVRAYTAYPSALKHIFHIRNLHLGHAAKSFGLRDAPQGLSAATGNSKEKKNKGKAKDSKRYSGWIYMLLLATFVPLRQSKSSVPEDKQAWQLHIPPRPGASEGQKGVVEPWPLPALFSSCFLFGTTCTSLVPRSPCV
uniref:ATP-dependent RNA helicase n=1 Tax=Astyanax mexicanus TaxID=7994 RepID=A0A8B9H5K3_ASTMX